MKSCNQHARQIFACNKTKVHVFSPFKILAISFLTNLDELLKYVKTEKSASDIHNLLFKNRAHHMWRNLRKTCQNTLKLF